MEMLLNHSTQKIKEIALQYPNDSMHKFTSSYIV